MAFENSASVQSPEELARIASLKLEETIEIYTASVAVLKRQREEATDKVADLYVQMARKDKEMLKMRDSLHNAEKMLESFNNLIHGKDDIIASLTAQLQDAKAVITSGNEELTQARVRMQELQLMLLQQQSLINTMKGVDITSLETTESQTLVLTPIEDSYEEVIAQPEATAA